MKVSDLIKKLQQLSEENGDVEIWFCSVDGTEGRVTNVEFDKKSNTIILDENY